MKLLNWIQDKLNKCKKSKTVPSHCKYNVKPGSSAGKEDSNDWAQGLLAIGTLGNENPAEGQEKKTIPGQENHPSPLIHHLWPGEIESIQELISMLGKQKENNHPEELVRFSEELQQKELDGAAEGGSHQCTTKWRDQSSDVSKNAIIRKKSLTFLLKIFLCRSGFPSIPILRDPPPEPRIEKILRTLLKKKIYPHQNSTRASSTRKRCQENNVQISSEASSQENKANEEASPGIKWVRTDSECAQHKTCYSNTSSVKDANYGVYDKAQSN